jgi:hypothetical protein
MSLPVTPVTDHVLTALGQLLGQFDNSPRLRALVEVIVDEVQRYEDLVDEVQTEILLDVAVGVQLDNIYGKIALVKRLATETDDDYRSIIKVAIRANNSDAHPDTVASVLGEGLGVSVQYEQVGEACFQLNYESGSAIDADVLERMEELLERAATTGVCWRVVEGSPTVDSRYNSMRYNSGRYGRIVAQGG